MFPSLQRCTLLFVVLIALTGCDLLTFEISGKITDATGGWIEGSTVLLNGAEKQTTTTNGLGEYTFTVHHFGNFDITPLAADFEFSPGTITVETTKPFQAYPGNDFIAKRSASATPIYQHSLTQHGVRTTLSVFAKDEMYVFELFRDGASSSGELAGCTVVGETMTARIPDRQVLAANAEPLAEGTLFPLHSDPSSKITGIALWKAANQQLAFLLWLAPEIACPAELLAFEIEPNFDVYESRRLLDFFATYQELAKSLVLHQNASYLGVDMKLSVYHQKASFYVFELLQNGKGTAESDHPDCIAARRLSVQAAQNTPLIPKVNSENGDLFYPIHIRPGGPIVLIAIRELNSESLQLLIHLHDDIACPTAVLLFDLPVNAGIADGDLLYDFLSRLRDDH